MGPGVAHQVGIDPVVAHDVDRAGIVIHIDAHVPGRIDAVVVDEVPVRNTPRTMAFRRQLTKLQPRISGFTTLSQ